MDLVEKIYNNILINEQHYHKFWHKILYSNAYVFMKNAILFYQNTQNNKFHNFFSGYINERLWSGKCSVASKQLLQSFNNDLTSDELCKLALQVINGLDAVFSVCPRLPIASTVYRQVIVPTNFYLLDIKKNQCFSSPEFISCSYNPYRVLPFLSEIPYLQHDPMKYLLLEILLPEGCQALYYNRPFTKDAITVNEMELLLPRNAVYKVSNKKKIGEIHILTIQLLEQSFELEPIHNYRNPVPITPNVFKCKSKKIINSANILEKLVHELYHKFNTLPTNEKHIDNTIVTIKPDKFWLFYNHLPNNKTFTLDKNNVISLQHIWHIERFLLMGNSDANQIATNIEKPIGYYLEVDNAENLHLQHFMNYEYKNLQKIKINIHKIHKKYIGKIHFVIAQCSTAI